MASLFNFNLSFNLYKLFGTYIIQQTEVFCLSVFTQNLMLDFFFFLSLYDYRL